MVCFDAFKSKELNGRLLRKMDSRALSNTTPPATFRKVRGYHLHSIDGMVLANGYHVLMPEVAASAGVLGDNSSTDDCR